MHIHASLHVQYRYQYYRYRLYIIDMIIKIYSSVLAFQYLFTTTKEIENFGINSNWLWFSFAFKFFSSCVDRYYRDGFPKNFTSTLKIKSRPLQRLPLPLLAGKRLVMLVILWKYEQVPWKKIYTEKHHFEYKSLNVLLAVFTSYYGF